MLKQLINSLIQPFRPETQSRPYRGPVIVPREQHPISRKQISSNALKVMKKLGEANYQAYLVGGGVRDILLQQNPKDFDIVTDATPEQIKNLFRNARIIGRRFRIVHVRFGREIIEVTTFRAHHHQSTEKHQAAQSDHGMLTRDNVYGDIRTDAARRDFTVNALYYTTNKFEIHDYEGGMEDIERRLVRMIGDPETRYKEDPVRMLRAVRFAAKLNFSIETATAKPIFTLGNLLTHVPSARLFEEVLKLFMAGNAATTLALLRQHNLFSYLFPAAHRVFEQDNDYAEKLIHQAMLNTDHRIQNNKRVTPAFIYAALLWPALQQLMQQLSASKKPPIAVMHEAAQIIISEQLKHTAVPKRFLIPMKEIWELQLRLPRSRGKKAVHIIEHARFRAAYDFVLLRESAGENLNGLGSWWTRFQDASAEERQKMMNQQGQQNKKYRRYNKKPKTNNKAS